MTELEKIIYDEHIYGCAYFKYENGNVIRIDPTTIRIEQLHKPVVGGPASASALDGEQLPAEWRGEANTCAGFWCQNEMYGKPRCSEVCTWCHGYRRG